VLCGAGNGGGIYKKDADDSNVVFSDENAWNTLELVHQCLRAE